MLARKVVSGRVARLAARAGVSVIEEVILDDAGKRAGAFGVVGRGAPVERLREGGVGLVEDVLCEVISSWLQESGRAAHEARLVAVRAVHESARSLSQKTRRGAQDERVAGRDARPGIVVGDGAVNSSVMRDSTEKEKDVPHA